MLLEATEIVEELGKRHLACLRLCSDVAPNLNGQVDGRPETPYCSNKETRRTHQTHSCLQLAANDITGSEPKANGRPQRNQRDIENLDEG